MLVNEVKPLPVREVAERLRVSRRTVFRELANIDRVLTSYGLEVGSHPGEGVFLEGTAAAKSKLLEDLVSLGSQDPADKQERHHKLVLAILRNPGQKLATYAEQFHVSVPTISHDLDEIEDWLGQWRLELRRKSLTGLSVAGTETAIRRLILHILYDSRVSPGEPGNYPHPDIILDLQDSSEELNPLLSWMTPQSRDTLNCYLAVMVQRVMDGYSLEEDAALANESGEYGDQAEKVAVVIQEVFNLTLNQAEKTLLAIELSACRPNALEGVRKGSDQADLMALAEKMVAGFDPRLAHQLYLDNILIEGLAIHLRSALVRIRHHIELVDPLLELLRQNYPDIMARCRSACAVLPTDGEIISDDEVILVATHFQAAILRLADPGENQVVLRVGIICVHGIGSSYLLASQVKRAFGSRIITEVGWHDDPDKWPQYDFLISTTELSNTDLPVVVVPTILAASDIKRIENHLSLQQKIGASPTRQPENVLEGLSQVEDLARAGRKIIEGFRVITLSGDTPFPALLERVGRETGHTPEAAAMIQNGLEEREKIASQVIQELGLVLLHCRTGGVDQPVFILLNPEGGFQDPYYRGTKTAVAMLVPQTARREVAEMLGAISTALIENPTLLLAIQNGGSEAVLAGLQKVLVDFLVHSSLEKLKG
jgi:mannitol operon transcriptional antiterminator